MGVLQCFSVGVVKKDERLQVVLIIQIFPIIELDVGLGCDGIENDLMLF